MTQKIFKSAYAGYSAYSFLVSWKTKKDQCKIETLSKSEALRLCAEMKEQFGAVCHQIDCDTGEKIKKLA